MTVIDVAIPMLRGKRHFYIEKGRRWSVIEHLMLDAVSRRPSTATALAQQSCLPPRVVVEAFIRLMRVGWVELQPGQDGSSLFTATAAGASQLGASELRAATRRDDRWLSFCFDQAFGNVFRGREFFVHKAGKLARSPGSHALVYLEKSIPYATEDLAAIFAALVNEDEIIVGMEPTPDKLMDGYAIVKVEDGVIDGLPARASDELRSAILTKAAAALPDEAKKPALPAEPAARPSLNPAGEVQGLFDHKDLILDGADHQAALFRALQTATEFVLIHSTFISRDGWKALMPRIIGAASRGAKVQILWGQSDDQNETSSSRAEATAFRNAVAEAGRSNQILVHPFTTGSHAKILLSDDGRGRWSSIVGSCNWLSTDFSSFEASVNLRDPLLVGAVLTHLANMTFAHDGIWTAMAADLTALSRRIASVPRGSGRTAKMRLLLAPDHAALVLVARDAAEKRMMVTSHRLGIASKPMVIAPALAAYRDKRVECSLFFGRATGALSGLEAAALTAELSRSGVTPRPVFKPRLHAKVLAWDDDSIAVTSQNWLSADPSDTAYRREIGVFVEQNKIADTFIRRFNHARSQ